MRYRTQRWPSDCVVLVKTGTDSKRAKVLNASTSGAKLAGLTESEVGQEIEMSVLNFRAIAVVARVSSDFVGVTFARPITPHQLSVLRNSRAGPGAVPPSRPRFGQHGYREIV